MLPTKILGNRHSGSWEDFERFLQYMGVAAILVKWPRSFFVNFGFCVQSILKMKYDLIWPNGFWEEEFFKFVSMRPYRSNSDPDLQ